MKYLVSTQVKCQSILMDMDTFYGYPNHHTVRTSEIVKSVDGNDYMILVPEECYEMFNEYDKSLCHNTIPDNFE